MPLEIIHGGNDALGYNIQSSLGLIGNYYEVHELAKLECVKTFRQHVAALYLGTNAKIRPGSNPRWPSIRVIPLDRLLQAIKARRDRETGSIQYQPGSLEYARMRSKTSEAGTLTWIGTDLELKQHKQVVTSFQYATCALNQENLGETQGLPPVRLHYFDYQQALRILSGASSTHTLWMRGQPRPTPRHMILIATDESGSTFVPFNLFTS